MKRLRLSSRRPTAHGRLRRTSSPRRRPSTASGAASCPSWRRASTSAISAASSARRSTRRRRISSDLDAIAVTQGPGLVGSLLVGVSFAKSLALSLNRPLVPVHHLAGHIESLFLQHGDLPLPLVALVVSGGHTSLYVVKEPGSYARVGRTRDDAAGEAYDKVAKLLGLGYPGGPIVDKRARDGNDEAVALPSTRMTHADRNGPTLKGDLDFSFSGLKTAVLRHVRQRADQRRAADRRGDQRHLRQLPARRGQRAARSHVRRGRSLRRAECRHCRRRVGELAAASRFRRSRGAGWAFPPMCRRCRFRQTTRR